MTARFLSLDIQREILRQLGFGSAVVDASDLGWPAGMGWPYSFDVIGHENVFNRFHVEKDGEGEVKYVDYRDSLGKTLRVYND